jgi:hypothetical protein
MSEVVARYITEVAVNTKANAELARRTNITVWDVVNSISELGTSLPYLVQFQKLSNDLPFIYGEIP